MRVAARYMLFVAAADLFGKHMYLASAVTVLMDVHVHEIVRSADGQQRRHARKHAAGYKRRRCHMSTTRQVPATRCQALATMQYHMRLQSKTTGQCQHLTKTHLLTCLR